MNGITVRATYRKPDKRRREPRTRPAQTKADYARALLEARRAKEGERRNASAPLAGGRRDVLDRLHRRDTA